MNDPSSNKPSSSVSSRFVSQTDLEEAQKRKEEEVRATYARLGQSPPPEVLARVKREADGSDGSAYDPRTLYERLKANKDAKQEALDEKLKLGNQFRGIDDGESIFLAQIAEEKKEIERMKKKETEDELEKFRQAALAKTSSPPLLPTNVNPILPSSAKNKSIKRKREGLLGVVQKKKKSTSNKGNGEISTEERVKEIDKKKVD